MNSSRQHAILSIMSGQTRGVGPALLRGGLRVASWPYAGVMRLRNRLFDWNVREACTLERPVISVGNITAGGTGKTPMVRWLAERLLERDLHPAILMRGYTVAGATVSDEQIVLRDALSAPGRPEVPVHANPDRVAGAADVLREHPNVDLFILDDGFQHRRVARQFNLVLINAVEPFGHGYVLPRGLLREPLSGLLRADAIVLTRSDHVSRERREEIERIIRRYNLVAPLYRSAHEQTGFRSAMSNPCDPVDHPPAWLAGRRFFAFSGIGSPQSFETQLTQTGGQCAGRRWFGDHHAYSPQDIDQTRAAAKSAGAEVILTTEKDWVKIADFPTARDESLPILRVDMNITFADNGGPALIEQIFSRIPGPTVQDRTTTEATEISEV